MTDTDSFGKLIRKIKSKKRRHSNILHENLTLVSDMTDIPRAYYLYAYMDKWELHSVTFCWNLVFCFLHVLLLKKWSGAKPPHDKQRAWLLIFDYMANKTCSRHVVCWILSVDNLWNVEEKLSLTIILLKKTRQGPMFFPYITPGLTSIKQFQYICM
jgi:hypothetical protein